MSVGAVNKQTGDRIPTAGMPYMPNYSTVEQKTGQKWIDNKDIYFKVVVLESAAQIAYNQWFNSGIDATGVSTIVMATAQTADGAFCPLIGATDNGHFIFLACRVDSTFSAKTIILYYTKEV